MCGRPPSHSARIDLPWRASASAAEGILVFDLPDNGTALRFASAPAGQVETRLSALRDLTIANVACCGQVGLEISQSGYVDLERVQISDFAVGVIGELAYSINIHRSRIFGNGFNVVLGYDTTAWRIRESTISQAFLAGLVFGPTARGNLVSGGRMESNLFTGILAHGPRNVVEHTWFEGNGGASNHAIKLPPFSFQNRILANLFASDEISNVGTDNQICFSIFRCRAGQLLHLRPVLRPAGKVGRDAQPITANCTVALATRRGFALDLVLADELLVDLTLADRQLAPTAYQRPLADQSTRFGPTQQAEGDLSRYHRRLGCACRGDFGDRRQHCEVDGAGHHFVFRLGIEDDDPVVGDLKSEMAIEAHLGSVPYGGVGEGGRGAEVS